MDSITLFGRTFALEQLKLGIIVLSGLLAVLLFFQSDWAKIDQWSQLNDELTKLESDLQAAEAQTQTEAQVNARLSKVQTDLQNLRTRFPARGQILSTLLVDLSNIFHEANTTLVSFQPKEFTPLTQGTLKDLGKMSIDITARGSYPSVILLFDLLGRYERVLTVENPQLRPGGKGELSNDLTVTFTLTTYALNQ